MNILEESDAAVVAKLLPYSAVLPGGASTQPPVAFVRATWERWLIKAELDPAFSATLFDQLTGDQISRSDLDKFANTGRGADADLRLFIATMIWGRGKSNARMLPHIVRTISHPKRAETLELSARRAEAGELESAYDSWNLPGIRRSFFTKWLWAASLRNANLRLRPLVLDDRVLRTLNGPLEWSTRTAANSTSWGSRYRSYVEAAHRWAASLSGEKAPISAEDIEFALFKAGGNLEHLVTHEG